VKLVKAEGIVMNVMNVTSQPGLAAYLASVSLLKSTFANRNDGFDLDVFILAP